MSRSSNDEDEYDDDQNQDTPERKRGKNWSYNDIINLIYGAIHLNIPEQIKNRKLPQKIIFKKLAKDVPDKTWNQVQIKYNKLRRYYNNNNQNGEMSDFNMFRDQMDLLWGNKKHDIEDDNLSNFECNNDTDDGEVKINMKKEQVEEVDNSFDETKNYDLINEIVMKQDIVEENDNDNPLAENKKQKRKIWKNDVSKDASPPHKRQQSSVKTLQINKLSSLSPSFKQVKGHPVDIFFQSMSQTVKTFPPHLIAQAKMKVCNVIGQLELTALDLKKKSSNDPLKNQYYNDDTDNNAEYLEESD